MRFAVLILFFLLVASACSSIDVAAPTTPTIITTVETTTTSSTLSVLDGVDKIPTTLPMVDPETMCVDDQPDWAPLDLSIEAFCSIVALIRAEQEVQFAGATFNIVAGEFVSTDGTTYGFADMVTSAALAEPADQAALIAGAFTAFIPVNDPPPTTTTTTTTPVNQVRYSDIRPSLRVLLYERDRLVAIEPDAANITAAPGLVAALVIDTPTKISHVTNKALGEWGVTFGDAFDTAFAQTMDYGFVLFDPAASITAVSSGQSYGNFYRTTALLNLASITRSDSEAGYIISIPRRSEFTIVDLDAVIAEGKLPPAIVVSTFADVTTDGYQEGPNPVSPVPFWWHDGTLVPLPIVDGDLVIPAELQLILG